MAAVVTPGIRSMSYGFNNFKNLGFRNDNLTGQKEVFSYDNLNRLLNYNVGGSSFGILYDVAGKGNISSKSDMGIYNYELPDPHRLDNITNTPGNLSDLPGQNITYTKFNKISTLTHTTPSLTKLLTFTYGTNEQRVKTVYTVNGNTDRTKYFALGKYEKEIAADNTTKELYYISTPTGIAAILEKKNNQTNLYYIHTDLIGSYDVVTNQSGTILERLSFDPWGRRRNPVDWTYTSVPATFLFDRGFTGHQHLDEFSLINMNGRVYDPLLAMFLSPDNYVQAPDRTQNYNRYAYCLNNPLIYTDPSGEGFLLTSLIAFAGQYAINWLSNVINNKMSVKEAFKNTPIIIGLRGTIPYNENKSPTNNYETSGTGISDGDLNNISTSADYVVGEGGKYLGESVSNYGGVKGLTINTFYGYSANGLGGVVISLTYTSTTEEQGGDWVQVISTDFPSRDKLSPYYDSLDGSIYYPDKTIAGNSISFYDNPHRPLYDAYGRSNNGDWFAFLSLYKGGKSIFGIIYGFDMHYGNTKPYHIQVIYP